MAQNNNPNNQFKEHQEFIVAEYNYIAQTAFQANEDRARVFEFFLISFGTFLASIFSSQVFSEPKAADIVFSMIFFVVSLLGASTVLELSRLRLAWAESVLSMNKMKDYLINNYPLLNECFSWRTNTIPNVFKLKSISFLKALQISVLSGISLGASVALLLFSCGKDDIAQCVGIIVSVFATLFYVFALYYRPLHNADITKEIRLLKNTENATPAQE